MYAFRMEIGKLDENIGCPVLLIMALLILLPSSSGYIDCRISCRRCHENTEHPSVLEVYCAMCEECKQRRRERMQGRITTGRTKIIAGETPLVRMRDGTQDSSEALAKKSPTPIVPPVILQVVDQHPPPMPPMLPQASPVRQIQRDANEPALIGWPTGCPTPPVCSDSEEEPEKLKYSSTTTTQATTAPPCPSIPGCKKKKRKHLPMMPMMPCIPCMPTCSCPMYSPPTPQILKETAAPTTQMDYHYVYIGIPKKLQS